MLTIIKIFIILLIVLLYITTIKSCFEYFVLPYNSDINIKNKSSALIDRHPIDSIDINVDYPVNAYYYEFSNNQYLKILNDMFKPSNSEKNILLNNINWSNNINESITPIYNKAYLFISNTIARFTPDVQIVHDLLNKFKIDKDSQEYLLDIDMILYRNYKLNGKHVNFLVYVNHLTEKMINIEIKGVVGEDKIGFHPITPYTNVTNFEKFKEIDTLEKL